MNLGKAVCGLVIAASSAFAAASDREVGNGGDAARASFIAEGQNVLLFLGSHDRGQAIAASLGVDLPRLASTLSVERIQVLDEPQIFVDSNGMRLDAVTTDGIIHLFRPPWERFFIQERAPFVLIFHEMLRSAAYDDDDFKMSSKIVDYRFDIAYIRDLVRDGSADNITIDGYQPWQQRLRCDDGLSHIDRFMTSGPYASSYYRFISTDPELLSFVRAQNLSRYFIDDQGRVNTTLIAGDHQLVRAPNGSVVGIYIDGNGSQQRRLEFSQQFRALNGETVTHRFGGKTLQGCTLLP